MPTNQPFSSSRLDDLKRFYDLLAMLEERLGGARRLSDCSGKMRWPKCGVYFFKEEGEVRADTGKGSRIVRVGTHALKTGSKTKLWTRLKQHKGITRTGGGNHRGSIFRKIVGAALFDRDNLNYPCWGKGDTASREVRISELPLEKTVSARIGGMPFLWLAIEDEAGPESLRGYIERNAIALLSNWGKHPIDPPSSWLGCNSDREKVRSSGLWNSNHVNEDYDPAFLDELARLIDEMEIPA
ncbi:MAG: hypothetical protein OXE44_08105 [Nitrospinae bacterium]|nr:hypothetical protein [Nitrospinota bacterium]